MKKADLTNPFVICILAGISCLLWGSAFPCVKIAYRLFNISSDDTWAQILFAGIRFFTAGLMIYLTCLVFGRRLTVKKESVLNVFKLASVQTVFQYFFFYVGLAHTSGVKASIIEATNVFFAILIPTLILRHEKLTKNKIAGCIIGFMGVAVINLKGNTIDAGFSFNGEFFLLVSTLMYAISSVMVKEYSKEENPVALSSFQFMAGGAVMTVAALIKGTRLQMVSLEAIMMLLYLAFISACAYSLWALLLKYNPVSSVAVYGFLNPVFGVLLSAMFLGEIGILNLTTLSCLVMVSAGIYLVNKEKKESAV